MAFRLGGKMQILIFSRLSGVGDQMLYKLTKMQSIKSIVICVNINDLMRLYFTKAGKKHKSLLRLMVVGINLANGQNPMREKLIFSRE